MKHKLFRALAGLLLAACLISPACAATIGGATVTGSDVRLRSNASTLNASNIIAEMPAGAFLLVEQRLDGWYKAVWNGTEGYVSADFVSFSENADGYYSYPSATDGTNINLRAAASTSSAVVKNLKDAGSALTVTGVSGQWLKVTDAAGNTGYIRSDLMHYKNAPAATQQAAANTSFWGSTGDSMVQTAMLYQGYSYRWGGMSPSTGFDCSGFVNYICKQYGVSLHRVAQEIYSYDGVSVSKSELQPGDILCFGYGPYNITHVGLYAGNGQMIHASTYSTGVILSDINSNYYTRMYVGAKRVV